MIRCHQQIQFEDPEPLAEWVDSNITPALRQDAQFVRDVIGSVCKRTIGLSDPTVQLRGYLGILNCLYGAPESLQHQALDSVSDLVESQHHPEEVLKKILNIMWFDGYISRQAIRLWYDNKRNTCVIGIQEKDLGEEMQERMRARQEVRSWMGDTTQMSYYWYDSPHYQRVALHALCQLAVTWQGDKCTVDKDLLLHYITELFWRVKEKIQLLYAVQCVLHHLQNPPGLSVAVLQALLTISRQDTEREPLITTTDWDKWRNTHNPLYEEGRNIIQQQGHFHDLIVLVSSKVTLTEINDWICENIQQGQMLDAFIIAVECLVHRGEEMALISDWISQNVPQSMETGVQDSLKNRIILKCIQEIQSADHSRLYDWVDRHILPAWRQDAQFVRAAIKAVCERTMRKKSVYSEELRFCLGALNCLYGAPESLQLQALDSVYDHVRILQNPPDVLQEILDVMCSEGYISRQMILSWFDNMDQTSVMNFQGILAGTKKDLGEDLQERMMARQEVRRWMTDTIQMRPYYTTLWYNLPHYQRVALHALCQLAVTWQGDKCTVDRDLLFLYIPQLFGDVSEKMGLLYAVQCVMFELNNPPGLVKSVLSTLVSHTGARTEPIITESQLEDWRKAKHSIYEEGREILMLALNDLNI